MRCCCFFSEFEEEYDKWIDRALVAHRKRGDFAARCNIWALIEGRRGGCVDKHITWCISLANSGDVEKMRFLARYYESIKDISQLIFWLNSAADAGDKDAIYKLIKLYEEGIEVPQDYSKVFELHEKLVELGGS